jgi:hypothetical protein
MPRGVTVDLTAGTSHGTEVGDIAAVGTDTFSGVNAVAGSAFNDTFTGSNNAIGTAEEFAGRAGDDHIDGLGGFDRAFYNNDNSVTSGIHVDMALGVVTATQRLEWIPCDRSKESAVRTSWIRTMPATLDFPASWIHLLTTLVVLLL